ncbi:MAG TPA: signal recognition particle receptor subunit alpha, partial [Myxococcus sp.]|nr:signal recognition particle receptor subunit alpha [Myxococcus sp.]
MPGLSHAPASLALSGGEGSCLRSEGRRPRPGRPHPPGRSGLARPHPGGFRAAKNRLAGKSELTPELVDESLRDIRVSLLEADVAFDVVK